MTLKRAVDHLVLAVPSLEAARTRLTQLGFTVAPDARHPFGTENACVFLADATYLEPLAIGSEAESLRSARSGNVFTARDRAFRFRHGPEGLEAVAFKSDDADADHADFVEAGLSAGEILTFSRPFKGADGSTGEAAFKLAFAADLRAPDFYAFSCQRLNMPQVDRATLAAHENGVVGLAGLVLTETQPDDFRDFLGRIVGKAEALLSDQSLTVAAANAALRVMTNAAFEDSFGTRFCAHGRGLRGRAVSFHVASLDAAAALFSRNGVVHARIGDRLIVPHAPGQGVIYSFEEKA